MCVCVEMMVVSPWDSKQQKWHATSPCCTVFTNIVAISAEGGTSSHICHFSAQCNHAITGVKSEFGETKRIALLPNKDEREESGEGGFEPGTPRSRPPSLAIQLMLCFFCLSVFTVRSKCQNKSKLSN